MSKQCKFWFVYVLRCVDGSLYCGITNDLEKRMETHVRGRASNYTRSRLPVALAHSWRVENRSEALRAEAAFKKLPRKEKLRQVSSGRSTDPGS